MDISSELDCINTPVNDTEDIRPGLVFAVPDTWWGFYAFGRDDHPGALIDLRTNGNAGILLKGSGTTPPEKYGHTIVSVSESPTNGLSKKTYFVVCPNLFRRHKLKNLLPQRVMGELSADDLHRLREAMLRQFGEEG